MNQMKRGVKAAKQLGSGATHVALCNKIGPYFRHWCKVLAAKRNCHSEGNNNFIPKNLVITNTDVYPSKSTLIEGRLMLQEVVHNNNFNSPETDHASMPLRIFASKSVSCRHSVLKLLLARNCHSYCCRRYEFRSSLPELATRPQFRNADLHLAAWLPSRLAAKKAAFTLAEVLITLGIIGIVAALTLPTVIQNYRKQETVAQLQKTYSTVNQALLQSIAENGDYINFDNANDDIGDEAFFKKYWLPYFKGATICNKQNLCGYVERGLLPSTFYCLNGILANGTGVSGNPLYITAIHYGRSTIMLPDGSVVIYFNGYGDNNQERLNTSWVLIDVNGGKEPNTYGKDVFFFDRNEKGAIVPRCKNLTTEQVNSDCSKTGTGECCAQKIINDGWKINY